MVAERRYIDLEDKPDLVDLTRIVREQGGPIEIREAGKTVAVFQPVPAEAKTQREITDEDRKAFREAAGSWKGLIDVDKFLEDNRASREWSSRPHVDL